MSRFTMGAMLSAALLSSVAANAAAPVGDPSAGLQAMRELNLIVLGDMKGGSNVEGKTFVGGNLSNAATMGIGRSAQGATPSSRATLTVKGSVTGGNLNLNNGQNGASGNVGTPPGLVVGGNLAAGGTNINAQNTVVQVGGSIKNLNGTSGVDITAGGGKVGNLNANSSITPKLNQGASFSTPLLAGLTAEQAKLDADLKQLSVDLAGMEATAGNSTSVFGNRLTFNAVDNGKGYSVFTLSDAIFGFSEFDLKMDNADTTIIFNISGDGDYKWLANSIGGMNASVNDNLIWNFSDATSLSIDRMSHGSILAPFAELSNKADIEGSIVAGSFKQGGQVHLGTYDGNFEVPAAPEPGTWAMLILGFGIVGHALRRRRSTDKAVAAA